jgi:hypothetical protein
MLLVPFTAESQPLGTESLEERLREFIRVRPYYRYEETLKFGKSTVPVLLKMLNDPQQTHKTSIIEMLGILGDDSVAQPLIDVLESDTPSYVKSSVLSALGRLAGNGSDTALDYLIEHASREKWMHKKLPGLKGPTESGDRSTLFTATLIDLGISAQPRAIVVLQQIQAQTQDEEAKLTARFALDIVKKIQRVGRMEYYRSIGRRELPPSVPTWFWGLLVFVGAGILGLGWLTGRKLQRRFRGKQVKSGEGTAIKSPGSIPDK